MEDRKGEREPEGERKEMYKKMCKEPREDTEIKKEEAIDSKIGSVS